MGVENFDLFLHDVRELDPSARSVPVGGNKERELSKLFANASDPDQLIRVPKFMFLQQQGRKSVVILDDNIHYDPMQIRMSHETKVRASSQDREILRRKGFDSGFMHPMFDNSDGLIERFYIDAAIAKQHELYPDSKIVLPAIEDGREVKVLCSIDAFMGVMKKHFGADNIYHANVGKQKWQKDPLNQYMVRDNPTSTRFAPSPTGSLHFGSLRSAIVPLLLALHNDGDFTLRIDDTNQEKSREEYVQDILEDLAWIGVDIKDHQMFRQSDGGQIERYQSVLKRFEAMGFTFEDDDGNIILNAGAVLNHEVDGQPYFDWVDHHKGPQILHRVSESRFLEDDESNLILAKRDKETGVVHARYKLAGALHDAAYSDVFRDYRQVALTQRQALVQLAMKRAGVDDIPPMPPIYGHVPLVSRLDGSTYSKSSLEADESIKFIRENGVFLPEAVLAAVLMSIVPSDEKSVPGMRNKDIIDCCARDGLDAALQHVAKHFDRSWVDDGIRKPKVYFSKEQVSDIEARIMRFMPEERFIEHLNMYYELPETVIDKLVENRAAFTDWRELTGFIDRWYGDESAAFYLDTSRGLPDARSLRGMLMGQEDGPSLDVLLACVPENSIAILPQVAPALDSFS